MRARVSYAPTKRKALVGAGLRPALCRVPVRIGKGIAGVVVIPSAARDLSSISRTSRTC